MKHVEAIKNLLEEGDTTEAQSALENLLALGPNNVEALKIKATIYASEGRFEEEEKTWYQILEINNEDEDAIEYIQQRQVDFYFTDDLPGGGRRFLAYPKMLVRVSLLGLIGCVSFLSLTKLSDDRVFQLSPSLIMLAFMVLVISPWVGIIYVWLKSLRNITVHRGYIEVSTRLKNLDYKWDDLERLCLIHSATPLDPNLRLVLIPKDKEQRPIELDLNDGSSAIRARNILVREISQFSERLEYLPEDSLESTDQPPMSF